MSARNQRGGRSRPYGLGHDFQLSPQKRGSPATEKRIAPRLTQALMDVQISQEKNACSEWVIYLAPDSRTFTVVSYWLNERLENPVFAETSLDFHARRLQLPLCKWIRPHGR